MKKTLSLILALIMVAAMFAIITVPASAADAAVASDVWDGTADTTWYDASKTEFTLTTAEQLAGLAKLVDEAAKTPGTAPTKDGTKDVNYAAKNFEGVTIKLGANMILNEGTFTLDADNATPLYNGAAVDETAINVWNPIGESANNANEALVCYNNAFWGNFDGCGYTISGMYINSNMQQQGLFASFAGKELKNVKITNSYVCADSRAGSLVGFISNIADNDYTKTPSHDVLVENIWSDAIVVIKHTSADVRSGGIVGISRRIGTLTYKDLTFEGTISAISTENSKGVKSPARNYGGVIGVTVDDDKKMTTYENIVMKGAMYADSVHTDPQTGAVVGNHCFGNITMKNVTVDIKDTNMTLENGFAAEHVVEGKADLNGRVTSYSALIGCFEKEDTVATYENCTWKHAGVLATGIGEMLDKATLNGKTGADWKNLGAADVEGATGHVAEEGSYTQAVPPTCTETGFISYSSCKYCGVIIDTEGNAVTTVIAPAACTLGDLVTGKPATCTEAGVADHYKCSVCNKLYDAEKNEITTTEIPAAHTLGDWVDEVAPTTEAAGVLGHYECSVCHKYFDADKNELASIEGAAKLTTAANTTAAPAPVEEKKGCGGFTAIGAVLALVAVTGAAIVIKKK